MKTTNLSEAFRLVSAGFQLVPVGGQLCSASSGNIHPQQKCSPSVGCRRNIHLQLKCSTSVEGSKNIYLQCQVSRFPCCVLLALSWNTNENPSNDTFSINYIQGGVCARNRHIIPVIYFNRVLCVFCIGVCARYRHVIRITYL